MGKQKRHKVAIVQSCIRQTGKSIDTLRMFSSLALHVTSMNEYMKALTSCPDTTCLLEAAVSKLRGHDWICGAKAKRIYHESPADTGFPCCGAVNLWRPFRKCFEEGVLEYATAGRPLHDPGSPTWADHGCNVQSLPKKPFHNFLHFYQDLRLIGLIPYISSKNFITSLLAQASSDLASMLQAISVAVQGIIHTDWHLFCSQLSLLFQAFLESHR